MVDTARKPPPEYRNIGIGQILTYRLPLAARVSILHRVSGMLLFLFLPFLLYLFEKSLTSELSFEAFKGFFAHVEIKLISLALTWAFLFHFCAGIRFLMMDVHCAVTKEGGRQTGTVVVIMSTLLTAVVALKLFGVF